MSRAARPGRAALASAALRSLRLVRWDDALVLQGAPLLGAVAAMRALAPGVVPTLLLLVAGSTMLVAHVFLLNDWLGTSADLRDPHRSAAVRRAGIDGAALGLLCFVSLAASLLLLGALGPRALTLAVAIAALSALYSGPLLHGKGIPIVSSILHLLGGVLHFLLGYSLFGAIDGRGLAIACFFALAFAAGHLTQEVRDHDTDLRNGITTNAVAFGKRRTFLAGLGFFTVADALLTSLALAGTVPRILALTAALHPIHVYGSLEAMREGLGFDSIRRLQIRYRCRYAVVGLAMAAAFLLLRTSPAAKPSAGPASEIGREARPQQRPG